MFTHLLQEWVSISGGVALTSVTQSASGWLYLPEFQDAVFWVDNRIDTPGAAAFQLSFDTAPLAEEQLFLSMVTAPFNLGANIVKSVLMNQNPTVPLATWVRWRLQITGATGPWQASFRIRVAANATAPLNF